MNETRNIIAGLEIGKDQSQLCYYDRKEREPISVSVKAGSNQYLFPTLLSKRPGKDTWHYGMEAQFFVGQEEELPVSGLLNIWSREEGVLVDEETKTPGELMEIYLRGCISLLGVGEPSRQIKAFMITVPKLSGPLIRAVYQAGEAMGFLREQIWVQDYEESFYYYVMNHRKDNWNRKIGWFLFEEDKVSFARLVMDNQRRPVTAVIQHGKTAELSKDPIERDENFYRLISQSCGNDTYSGIYMVGEGFDQEWAVRSSPHFSLAP